MTVADRQQLEEAAGILKLVCNEAPTVDANTRHLSVPAAGGARTLIEVVRRLDAAGIEPTDIGIHRATLDDVFMALTGVAVSADDEQPAPVTAGQGKDDR
jgi:ABC-2 type transport system ATP-binding protein